MVGWGKSWCSNLLRWWFTGKVVGREGMGSLGVLCCLREDREVSALLDYLTHPAAGVVVGVVLLWFSEKGVGWGDAAQLGCFSVELSRSVCF